MTKEQILKDRLGEGWYSLLHDLFDKLEMESLNQFLAKEYSTKKIFPYKEDIFKAFKVCPLENLKLIILGADCYYTMSGNVPTANGIAFSSSRDNYCPPSLKNIFDSLEENVRFGLYLDRDVSLKCYTGQGVLFLNSALTVEYNNPGSHIKEWKYFTTEVIRRISLIQTPLVFMFWGNAAKGFSYLVNKERHLLLEASHPASAAHSGGKWLDVADHWEAARGFIYRTSKGEKTIKW